MSCNSGPNLSENGLVFAYDMFNTKKSWKGAPTYSLLDLTNKNTITQNNLVYNADESFSFNGTSSYLRTSSLSQTTFNTLTVGAWIYSSNYAKTYMGIISDAAYRHRLELRMNTNLRQINFLVGSTDSPTGPISTTTLVDNRWYYVVGTFDRTLPSNNIKIYINGKFETATTYTGQCVFLSNKLDIGSTQANVSGLGWQGNISNATFYNRCLSDNEILQNFQSLRSRYGV